MIEELDGKKVLVTGATGFTGSLLVRKLIKRGAIVRAVARPTSNLETLKDLSIEWVRGDIFDAEIIDEAIEGIEYVFHLAAAFREEILNESLYRLVHVESTKLLASAALRQKGFNRFVHVSTIGVHGHIENPPADEDYSFNPEDHYQKTKAEAELWIKGYAEKTKLPITIIRPCAIYGPGDKRLLKLFKLARMPIVPIIGNGEIFFHLIHVEDLTDFIIFSAIHPGALGEIFICGNEEALTLKEIISIISNYFGKVPRYIHLPAVPFFYIAAFCEKTFPLFNCQPPIYKRRVAFFTKSRSFDTGKMRKLFSFPYHFDNVRGLQETASWYIKSKFL